MSLHLRYWPDPVLREVCAPFCLVDPEIDARALAAGMWEIMQRKSGLGLAAPQVGVKRRMFVLRLPEGPLACFNPLVEERLGDVKIGPEGCLSFPGLFYPIGRHSRVLATYQDYAGNHHRREFEGVFARCYLHELDHLDGVTIEQRVTSVARALAAKKRKRD
jgi:peptide deformylase